MFLLLEDFKFLKLASPRPEIQFSSTTNIFTAVGHLLELGLLEE